MRALFDVNVLIALLDSDHIGHEQGLLAVPGSSDMRVINGTGHVA